MFFVGLDLGQKRDFSAVAVVEREERMAAGWSPRASGLLTVRHLERMQLGTSYKCVTERVCAIMRNPKMAGQSRLVVDATGLGAPVVEMLQGAGMGGRMTAVTITGGEEAHGSGERWSVPKNRAPSSIAAKPIDLLKPVPIEFGSTGFGLTELGLIKPIPTVLWTTVLKKISAMEMASPDRHSPEQPQIAVLCRRVDPPVDPTSPLPPARLRSIPDIRSARLPDRRTRP